MTLPHNRLPARQVIYLTDIKTVETDDTCGMRYWLAHKEAGKGILKKESLVADLLDAEIHHDLRTLSLMPDISPPAIQALIDEVLSHLTPEDKRDIQKMELLYRRLGWFAAFALYVEPTLRLDYETLPIDSELVLDKNPLFVTAYPDRLLKEKKTGNVIYREYVPKDPGLSNDRWNESWHYNARLHVGLVAAQENLDDPTTVPHCGQMMGLAKGYRSMLDHRLVHPYVWGHYSRSLEEWTHSTIGRDGVWELSPSWTFPGGIVAWVRMCGESTARGQFTFSDPVFLNKSLFDSWCARRVHREREIQAIQEGAAVNHHLRSIYFGKISTNCYPLSGDPCPYTKACWDHATVLAPLQSGEFIRK